MESVPEENELSFPELIPATRMSISYTLNVSRSGDISPRISAPE